MLSDAESPATVGRLYAEHRGWLHGLLWRQLGCTHKAEDLTQDTFVKVLAARAAEAIREPRAFLRTISHGLLVGHWQRLELERAYLAALAQRCDGLSPSPEERAEALEALCEVAALLERLPPRAARAFVMAQVDGLTYADIGGRLGVSERMVKKYMAQAMEALLAVRG